MFNQYEALKREIEALKKEIQTLKDDQIKQNRDYKDAMYNLDSDNVPDLAAVVKEIRLVVKDGKVSGAFIIAAINDEESGAQIIASHINLDGMTIQLNGKNGIKIDSPNFKVDEQGNMKCNNAEMNSAEIKQSCILGSDLSTGVGMQIGRDHEANGKSIKTRLISIDEADELRDSTTKGVAFETRDRVSDEEAYLSNVESNNYGATVRMYKETYNSRGELDGFYKVSEVSAGRYSSRIEFGDVFLEIDDSGIHYGDRSGDRDLFRKE